MQQVQNAVFQHELLLRFQVAQVREFDPFKVGVNQLADSKRDAGVGEERVEVQNEEDVLISVHHIVEKTAQVIPNQIRPVDNERLEQKEDALNLEHGDIRNHTLSATLGLARLVVRSVSKGLRSITTDRSLGETELESFEIVEQIRNQLKLLNLNQSTLVGHLSFVTGIAAEYHLLEGEASEESQLLIFNANQLDQPVDQSFLRYDFFEHLLAVQHQ